MDSGDLYAAVAIPPDFTTSLFGLAGVSTGGGIPGLRAGKPGQRPGLGRLAIGGDSEGSA